jgi:hypothetical protein|nr:MAG TPA: hypothetical protein [Caudoviricetes sp.]
MAITAEKLSIANYNKLDNIPVVNQDLTASDFTPVANTYYRHTGATTDTFTQGIIYLYDTAYHKLGESGGGTTLNKYVLTLTTNGKLSSGKVALINRIMRNAKSYVLYQGLAANVVRLPVTIVTCNGSGSISAATHLTITYSQGSFSDNVTSYIVTYAENQDVNITSMKYTTDGVTVEQSSSGAPPLFIQYFNDTEIT